MNPKVSICIPAYNQVHILKLALDSILAQEYQDYEVVITDDSTTDQVKVFVETYADRFGSKLFFYKNDIALGAAGNSNYAISKSAGEYIKMLHADDWFSYTDSLTTFVNLLEENPDASIGVVYSRNINTENFETVNIHRPGLNWIQSVQESPLVLLRGNYIGGPSATIFRRPDCYTVFDINLDWLHDLDGYITLLTKNNSMLALAPTDAISKGRWADSLTNYCVTDKNLQIFEFFYLLDKWGIEDLTDHEELLKKAYKLLKRFKINHVRKIRQSGYTGKLPRNTYALLDYIRQSGIKIP